jgi:hypothetical protein
LKTIISFPSTAIVPVPYCPGVVFNCLTTKSLTFILAASIVPVLI